LLPAPQLAVRALREHRLPVVVEWTPVDGAAAYRVQWATDDEFTRVIHDATVSTSRSQSPESLTDGRYAWRVRPIDAVGLEGFDAHGTLEIALAPVSPAPPHPEAAQRRDAVLVLRWRRAESHEKDHYDYQFATDAAFSDVIHSARVDAPEASIPVPPPGVYYLRVRAVDAQGTVGSYSAAQSIPVEPARPYWLLLPLLLLFL
jgi:predicted phage tail protein